MPEITYMLRISSWNFVHVSKAWLCTRTKFQLEILIRRTILVIYKFREGPWRPLPDSKLDPYSTDVISVLYSILSNSVPCYNATPLYILYLEHLWGLKYHGNSWWDNTTCDYHTDLSRIYHKFCSYHGHSHLMVSAIHIYVQMHFDL